MVVSLLDRFLACMKPASTPKTPPSGGVFFWAVAKPDKTRIGCIASSPVPLPDRIMLQRSMYCVISSLMPGMQPRENG